MQRLPLCLLWFNIFLAGGPWMSNALAAQTVRSCARRTRGQARALRCNIRTRVHTLEYLRRPPTWPACDQRRTGAPASEPAPNTVAPASEPAPNAVAPASEPAPNAVAPASEPAPDAVAPASEPAPDAVAPASEPAPDAVAPASEPASGTAADGFWPMLLECTKGVKVFAGFVLQQRLQLPTSTLCVRNEG